MLFYFYTIIITLNYETFLKAYVDIEELKNLQFSHLFKSVTCGNKESHFGFSELGFILTVTID